MQPFASFVFATLMVPFPVPHQQLMRHRPFPSSLQPLFQGESLLRVSVFIDIEIRANYHQDLALRLASKERLQGTWKWSIRINNKGRKGAGSWLNREF